MEEEAKRLYNRILQIANHFLHNCRRFSVDVLVTENPSYEDVAKIAKEIAKILWAISDDFDPMMSQKAFDYCHLMSEMSKAINDQNQDRLHELTAELDRMPFL